MSHWAEQPLGGGAGGVAFTIGAGGLRGSASADAPKPKQPFLRRNTGLQKRVLDAKVKRWNPTAYAPSLSGQSMSVLGGSTSMVSSHIGSARRLGIGTHQRCFR